MGIYDSSRYATFEYTDETSSFDPEGVWSGGDYYTRSYRCRVPKKMLERLDQSDDDAEVFDWIERNCEKDIWIN